MPPSGRRLSLRSATVAAATTLSLACALTACGGGSKGSKKADHAEICVHRQTMMRVADNLCLSDRTGVYSWYYIPRKNTVPNEGSSYTGTGGTFTRPNTGTVTRGGFGGDGSSGGGGG